MGQEMIDQIIHLMMGGSPMLAFAMYLIWSNSRSEKKLDEMSKDFVARLDKITEENKRDVNALRDRYEQREDEQRERWQGVVNQVSEDRDNMERDLLRTAQTTQETVLKLSQAIDGFNVQMTNISNHITILTEKITQVDQKSQQLIHQSNSTRNSGG